MQADVLTTVILPVSMFLIMLGMGLTFKPIDFKMVIIKPKTDILGLVAQTLILPLFVYAIVLLYRMTGALAVRMIFHHFKSAVSEKVELPVKIFSMAFLFLIVIGIIVKNLDQMGSYISQVGLATLVLNLMCLLVGYGAARLAKLNEAQSKAIGI